jgi:hypothetical protein
MSQIAPTGRPSAGRRVAGVVAGLVALALLGYPILVTAMLAYVSFSGCFIDCGAPQPGRGVAWSVLTALLLAAPACLGLAVAGARRRGAWLTAGGAVVAVVVA